MPGAQAETHRRASREFQPLGIDSGNQESAPISKVSHVDCAGVACIPRAIVYFYDNDDNSPTNGGLLADSMNKAIWVNY